MTLEFTSLTSFTKIFIETMNKHAPVKKNILAQTTPILLQKVYGAIMLRFRIRHIFLKEKYLKSKKAYNKQHNICVKVVKKAKKEHSQDINLSEIIDNKKFWKTVSPLFGNKVKTNHKINLIEKNVLSTTDEEIAKTFKKYFDEIVPKLNIIQNKCYIRKTENIEDPVKKALFKDQNHPSIANFEDIMKSKMYPLSVSSLFQ